MWGRGAGAGASPSTTRTSSRPAAAGRRSRRRTTSRATRASTRTVAAPAARTDTSQRGAGSRMSADRPLRVAVVGSGPAGFYAAGHLLASDVSVEVDVIERLPTPWGLVRLGVAPDHPNIKAVSRAFEKIAARPGFRFLGNVAVGRDVAHDELTASYDAVIYANGAQTDRQLGIPGEDLPG